MFHLLLAIIYVSFISLGLPDGLLGSAWPVMYEQLQVPVSWSGLIFMIISAGTIISSLQSDRLTKRFGTGIVTAVSVAMTAAALFGFSFSTSFWQLCFWAVPYELGAGGVDASLNNYVALHYESRHMSWLHCMWGVGATTGPYIMGAVLSGGGIWNQGYRLIGLIQIILTAALFFSLPLWKGRQASEEAKKEHPKSLSLGEILKIPGAKEIMVTFFGYCALEQTAGLWASSYLVLNRGIDADTAAGFAGLFFIGITIGRAISGFLTMKFNDESMIRLGLGIVGAGLLLVILPLSNSFALIGLVIVGLGCAPIYPCIIHSTPTHFGAKNSQAIVGVQMASAYVGNLCMPPLFGIIANHIDVALFPWYLLILLLLMILMHEQVCRKTTE